MKYRDYIIKSQSHLHKGRIFRETLNISLWDLCFPIYKMSRWG